jgi:hypothetical protein
MEKANIMSGLFGHDIKQKAYTSNYLIIGLPVIKPNYMSAVAESKTLPYSVYGISLRLYNRPCSCGIYTLMERTITEAVFKIKATIDDDIYNLYCFEYNRCENVYGNAMIPTYKSSVMMNSLFRNIKENSNLDRLEESDSEDEFENTREDKFVNLNKTLIMKCVYNRKFRKWQPIDIVENGTKLITRKEVELLEKK